MKSSLSAFLRGGILSVAVGLVGLPGKSFGQVLVSFGFTGAEQTWVVPSGINSIRIDAGGGGGGGGLGKGGSGGGGATSIFYRPGSGDTLWVVAGGGGGGGGKGNTVSQSTYGGNGGSAAFSMSGYGGAGTEGADGGGRDGTYSGGGGPGGSGGDPSSGSGLGGGKGGSLLYEAYRMDGSTYPAVLSGGYGFSSGDIGEDAQYLGPVDGGLSGGIGLAG